MALSLGQQNVLKQRPRVLRTDIIKFADDIQLITTAGPPKGQWELGTLFFNNDDKKLYASANYRNNNLPESAWYKFDGNTQDFSGNLKHGTLTGGSYEAGKYSKSLKFDGTDDKLELPATLFTDIENGFQFNFWINLSATFANGDEVYILERYVDATHFFLLSITGNATPKGQIRLRFDNDAGAAKDQTYTTEISLNTWINITIVNVGSSTTRIYVNGVGESQAIGAIASTGFTTELYEIGRSQKDSSFGDNSFRIDSLKFWLDDPGGFDDVGTIDKSNLDANQWASYPGTYVENT